MTSPNSSGAFADECTKLRNETYRAGPATVIEARPNGVAAQYIWWCIYTSLLCLFIVVFGIFKYLLPTRRSYSRIQHRPFGHLVITHFGAALTGLVCSWYQTHPIDEGLPCWLFLTAYFFQIPCLVFPLIARMLAFYREAQWTAAVVLTSNKMDAEHQRAGSMSDLKSLAASEAGQISERAPSEITFKRILSALQHLTFCRRVRVPRIKQDESGSVQPQDVENIALDSQVGNERIDLRMLKFLKSDFGAYITMFFVFTPFMLTLFVSLGVSPLVKLGCIGCYPSFADALLLAIESVLIIIILIMCYRLNLARHDPLGIVNEVRLVVWLGGVPAVILNIVNTAVRPHLERSDFQLASLIEASLLLYCFSQSGLQVIFAILDRVNESQAMARINYNIKDFEQEFLMRQGKYTQLFTKHLISEHGFESLAFLSSVYTWEHEFFDVSPRTAKARAKKICHMYVGDTAELPCNLSSKSIRLMQAALEKDEDVKFDLFLIAKSEIIKLLYGDSFRRFIRSKEYRTVATMATEITSSPSHS